MIKVDISNVWGQVTLSDLLAMEKEVAAAHTTLADGTGAGNDFLGWQNLPVREATEEITRIQRAAEKIRSDSDVFVVIGIGGSYLGPRAAIELLQGPNHNIGKGKGNPQIFFAGNGLSTDALLEIIEWQDRGYDQNVSLTPLHSKCPWNFIFTLPQYQSDYNTVSTIEGGALFAEGVWRPEPISCMNDNRLYFNAPSRVAIVKRIVEIAGTSFSMQEFIDKDYDRFNTPAVLT